jgi:hypothetical protein
MSITLFLRMVSLLIIGCYIASRFYSMHNFYCEYFLQSVLLPYLLAALFGIPLAMLVVLAVTRRSIRSLPAALARIVFTPGFLPSCFATVLLIIICFQQWTSPGEYKNTVCVKLPNGDKFFNEADKNPETNGFRNRYYLAVRNNMRLLEPLGSNICDGAVNDDEQPQLFSYGDITVLVMTCEPGLLIRLPGKAPSDWASHGFDSELPKFPLLAHDLMPEETGPVYKGYSKFISYDKTRMEIVVENYNFIIRELSFKLSADGKKLDLVGLRRTAVGDAAVLRHVEILRNAAPRFQVRAAEFLGKIKKQTAVSALMAAVGSSADEAVRETSIRSLGAQASGSSVGTLIAALKDKSPAIRIAAAAALGGIQDERAAAPLEALLNDSDEQVQSKALMALGQAGALHSVAYIKTLLNDRKDEKWFLRYSAAKALGNVKEPESVDLLAETILHDPHPLVQFTAAEALVKLQDSRAVEPLVKGLGGASKDAKFAVSWALVNLTKKNFGFDEQQWTKWWFENKTIQQEKAG